MLNLVAMQTLPGKILMEATMLVSGRSMTTTGIHAVAASHHVIHLLTSTVPRRCTPGEAIHGSFGQHAPNVDVAMRLSSKI